MTSFIKSLLISLVAFIGVDVCHAKGGKNKRAVIVYDDLSGKVLHEEYANELRHPASMAKKMALYVVFQALKARKIHFYTAFPISKRAVSQEPCIAGYKVGEKQTVIDLIKAGVTQSANDGLVALAEGLCGSVEKFVQQMNATAKELGMSKTVFYNPTGLPHPYQVTTAYDMLILARALIRDFPEYYQFFRTINYSHKGRNFRNHNRMLGVVEGMDGIKTGFVNASGFNVSTSTVRNGRRIYVVFMGGSSWRARDKEVVGFIEAAFRTAPQVPSLAPEHKNLTTDELNAQPHLVETCAKTQQGEALPQEGNLVQYLNGVDAQSDLQSQLEATPKSKTQKPARVVSLSSIKSLNEGKMIKAVLRKPVSKKSKKSSKRKRA